MYKIWSIFVVLCTLSPLSFAGWEEHLAKHKITIEHKTAAIIYTHYQAYKANQLPKIADGIISTIPIRESGEGLIDIRSQNNTRIKMLPDPNSPYDSPDSNSGYKAASLVRITIYNKLLKVIEELDESAENFGYEPGQVSISVFEGVREIGNQQMLFDNKVAEVALLNPDFTEQQVLDETSKWISTSNNHVPVHSTGGAIDFRLYDEQSKELIDMGKFGAIWGQNETAPTYSAELSDEQINNRLYLLIAASKAGLTNYPYEYWHFSSGDQYAAYFKNKYPMESIYNTVDTN